VPDAIEPEIGYYKPRGLVRVEGIVDRGDAWASSLRAESHLDYAFGNVLGSSGYLALAVGGP
jgi:hypothetical protein